jgi:hypothetical protein
VTLKYAFFSPLGAFVRVKEASKIFFKASIALFDTFLMLEERSKETKEALMESSDAYLGPHGASNTSNAASNLSPNAVLAVKKAPTAVGRASKTSKKA